MEFPAYKLKPVSVTDDIISALGARPAKAYLGRDLLCVFSNEKITKNLVPDQQKLLLLAGQGVHVTAPRKLSVIAAQRIIFHSKYYILPKNEQHSFPTSLHCSPLFLL